MTKTTFEDEKKTRKKERSARGVGWFVCWFSWVDKKKKKEVPMSRREEEVRGKGERRCKEEQEKTFSVYRPSPGNLFLLS